MRSPGIDLEEQDQVLGWAAWGGSEAATTGLASWALAFGGWVGAAGRALRQPTA